MYQSILKSMGVDPAKTIYEMEEQVTAQLAASRRPLIVDECDHLVAKGIIEVVRDIYEGSQATLLLLGEELLPQKLKKWERFHSRVLSWIPAQPITLADAEMLLPIYCPNIHVGTDLLEHLVKLSGGSVRRVSVNLSDICEKASLEGWDRVTRAEWGDRAIYTGEAPRRAV